MDVQALVEPDRVHRTVYTDQQIFDQEMTRIFERVWVYRGHESQIPGRTARRQALAGVDGSLRR